MVYGHNLLADVVILDGDFLREYACERLRKKTAVSLQLIAGSPVSIADQYNTVGNNLKFYQNREMLAFECRWFCRETDVARFVESK